VIPPSHLATALADYLLSRTGKPRGLACSPGDVYLAPHSDDIAFSIGCFTKARGCGRLLTIFGTSNHVAAPSAPPLSTAEVTRIRHAEDARFAQTCGLTHSNLGLLEATLRGHEPMDFAAAPADVPAHAPAILEAILALGGEKPFAERPWLFAPMGLGGHIDHMIVFHILARNRPAIERRFRLAFYEDLPYAAYYHYRISGLARFLRSFAGLGWRRHVMPLGPDRAAKLELAGIYESQLAAKPADIKQFSPECRPAMAPHEAVWVRGSTGRG
jgi:hypothetical protein